MTDKLKRFKVGDIVRCPADRGAPAYTGKVVHAGGGVNHNLNNTPYTWVEVQNIMTGRKAVWPSNRLSLA